MKRQRITSGKKNLHITINHLIFKIKKHNKVNLNKHNSYIKEIIHYKIKVRNIFNHQQRIIIKYPKHFGENIYNQIRVKRSFDCIKNFA
jgi:hypothetical protein